MSERVTAGENLPMSWRSVVVLTLMLAAPVPVRAEPTYEQWAHMGKKMYLAFRCAALAQAAKLPEAEFLRLFTRGIELGRPLLSALFEKRVEPRNDIWIMPLGALECAHGPTAEFVLGRIWQCASNDALMFLDTDEAKRIAGARAAMRGTIVTSSSKAQGAEISE
jgi:hypothetical protein